MAPSPSLIEKYQRILQADPRSRIFVELARQLLEARSPERAAEVCARGLVHHPTSVQGRVIWGKALLALGRPDEAVARFEQALEADPGNPYAYDLVGEVLVQSGLAERALPLLERGAASHPGDGRIRKWLAEAARAAAQPAPAPTAGEAGEAGARSSASGQDQATDEASAATMPPATGGEDAGPGPGAPEAPLVCDATAAQPPPPFAAATSEAGESPGSAGPAPGSDDAQPEELDADRDEESTPTSSAATARQPPQPGDPDPASIPTPSGSFSLRPPPLKPDPRRPRDGDGGSAADTAKVLELIPEGPSAPVQPAAATPTPPPEQPPAADEESAADAAARTYEHQLREKFLAESPPGPSFLRRHALGAALVGIVLAVAAGASIYLGVRASRRAVEARAAVDSARKGLARDTLGSLREAQRVLERARRAAPTSSDAAAVEAEVTGLLARDFGDGPARVRARELVATGVAGAGAPAARWLVADRDEEAAAANALLEPAADATPLARALAGEILLARRDREGARIHLEAAARATPPLLRALAALGDLELAEGNADAALERYALVLRAHPTHPHAALGAAEARLRLGRELPEALRTLEAVDAAPESAPALRDRLRMDVLLARLLAEAGRTADAERRLRDAAARYPAQAEIAAAQADVFAHAGDLDRAVRSAEGAARLAPAEPGYRDLLARLQLRRGLYRELLAGSESAPSRSVRLYRGVARLELGQPAQALAELEGTRRDGKMPAEAAGWMAIAHLAAGHRPQAEAIVGALLRTPNPHPLALVARGRLDLAAGRADSAERRFREAVDRDPDLVLARCDLGRILLARGGAVEARDVLEKAVARNPHYLPARLELGRARLATGDASGAVRALELVRAERPHDVAVLVASSSAHLAAGSYGEARRLADHALQLAPRYAAAALAAGRAAAAQGDVRDARKLLERAAKLAGKGPEAVDARRTLASLRTR